MVALEEKSRDHKTLKDLSSGHHICQKCSRQSNTEVVHLFLLDLSDGLTNRVALPLAQIIK